MEVSTLVLFILGVPMSILLMIQSLTHNPRSGVLGLIQVVALLFLFQGESSAWFETIKQAKDQNAQQPL